MKGTRPVLPPLWTLPTAAPATPLTTGHNGGPPLNSRTRWADSAEVREAILEHLADGLPIAVIATLPGMPPATTIRRWRDRDETFGAHFRMSQEWGCHQLAGRVTEEIERNLVEHGAKYARRVFAMRRHQLARQAPNFFGGP